MADVKQSDFNTNFGDSNEPNEFDPIDPTPLTMIKEAYPTLFIPGDREVRKTISLYNKPHFQDLSVSQADAIKSSET